MSRSRAAGAPGTTVGVGYSALVNVCLSSGAVLRLPCPVETKMSAI